jgi:hypothetical protein
LFAVPPIGTNENLVVFADDVPIPQIDVLPHITTVDNLSEQNPSRRVCDHDGDFDTLFERKSVLALAKDSD